MIGFLEVLLLGVGGIALALVLLLLAIMLLPILSGGRASPDVGRWSGRYGRER